MLTTLKKLPVGILVFLMFAVTGIGAAEIFHNRQESQRNESSETELEGLDSINSVSKGEFGNDSVSSVQSKTSVYKSKSSDDNSEMRQSSKGREDDDDEDEDEREDEGDDDSRSRSSQTTVSPEPTPSPTPASVTVKTFTMAQVATHNSSASCYSAINGNVYDLTSWIGQHPGGSAAIKSICGIDGTSAFVDQHSGQPRPASELAGFKIGVLIQ